MSKSYLFNPGANARGSKGKIGFVVLLICGAFGLLYYIHISGNTYRFIYKAPKYNWKPEYSNLNGPDISWRSESLVSKLRDRYLSKPHGPAGYNLSEPWESDPSMGQSQIVRELFTQNNGFFVECGALDGETRSNTLYLERFRNWSGLLIEADPTNFKLLTYKQRKAIVSNSCLSVHPYPVMVSFEQNNNLGKISSVYSAGVVERNHVDVQCFPFNTYMLALNITTVDYFSLDVEGAELDVLKTIDFSRFNVKVLSVEFIHDVDGKDSIRAFMEKQGYVVLTEVTHPNWLANDFIFVKKLFADSLTEHQLEFFSNTKAAYAQKPK